MAHALMVLVLFASRWITKVPIVCVCVFFFVVVVVLFYFLSFKAFRHVAEYSGVAPISCPR